MILDSVVVRKLYKNNPNYKAKAVQVLKSIKRFESHSTKQNIVQQYYQSYCHYLLKMGRMDEEQAIFEQLTLSDFKKLSSAALKLHCQV